jgi:hypothetical protein
MHFLIELGLFNGSHESKRIKSCVKYPRSQTSATEELRRPVSLPRQRGEAQRGAECNVACAGTCKEIEARFLSRGAPFGMTSRPASQRPATEEEVVSCWWKVAGNIPPATYNTPLIGGFQEKSLVVGRK